MCALFCVLGGMELNNRAFRKKSTKSKAKKLEMVLRRLTCGAMTTEQTRRLQSVLSYRQQYRLRLCTSEWAFRNAVAPSRSSGEKKQVRPLLDEKENPESTLLAALVCQRTLGKAESTVYLYLPKRKEAMRDDPRAEETKEA